MILRKIAMTVALVLFIVMLTPLHEMGHGLALLLLGKGFSVKFIDVSGLPDYLKILFSGLTTVPHSWSGLTKNQLYFVAFAGGGFVALFCFTLALLLKYALNETYDSFVEFFYWAGILALADGVGELLTFYLFLNKILINDILYLAVRALPVAVVAVYVGIRVSEKEELYEEEVYVTI